MYEYEIGRVVGSRIRNGNILPTDFTGWFDGDIFILNDEAKGIPYYEYKPETEGKLILLGNLKGTEGLRGFTYIGDILEDPFVSIGSPLDVYTTPGNYVFNMSYGSVICLMSVFEYYDKINQKIIKLSNGTIETITRQQQDDFSWDVSNSLPLKPYVNHNVSVNLERKEGKEIFTAVEEVECYFNIALDFSRFNSSVQISNLVTLINNLPYGIIPATGTLYIYNVDHYVSCLVTGLEKDNTDKLYIKYIDITDEIFNIGVTQKLLIDIDLFNVTITSNAI